MNKSENLINAPKKITTKQVNELKTSLFNKLKIEMPVESSSSSSKSKSKKVNKNFNRNNRNNKSIFQDDMFKNLLGSDFMGNPQIMNIANDIATDIQKENIDPMTLLSSMMAGGNNNKVNKLISNITNKLENKINNGEIDENALQQQASNMINFVQNSEIANNPMFKSLLNNLTKK
jgi:hypothetical protein